MDATWSVGIYQGGASLLPLVWEHATVRFEVDSQLDHLKTRLPLRPRARDWSDVPERTSRHILDHFPVDALVLDHSRDYNIASTMKAGPVWHQWMTTCDQAVLPRIVVQVWQSWASGSEQGPLGATQRKLLQRLGYDSQYALMDTVQYGSPVQQERLLIVSYLLRRYPTVHGIWDLPQPDNLPPRPMSNCLRPFGVGPTTANLMDKTLPAPPNSIYDPMPNRAGALIRTPAGYRRLFSDELAKGLGVPSRWNPDRRLFSPTFDVLPGTHVWETLGVSLATFLNQEREQAITRKTSDPSNVPSVVSSTESDRDNCGPPPEPPAPSNSPMQNLLHCRAPDHGQLSGDATTKRTPHQPPLSSTAASRQSRDESDSDHHAVADPPANPPWEWKFPDLRPNRVWNKRCIRNLKKAAQSYPAENRATIIAAGREDICRHRANYGDAGPVYLQVLWWEFPKEHWEALRTGCSMNFLRTPSCQILPNSEMDTDQQAIALEFFDELVQLGALERAPAHDPIVSNAPLFCIPKSGQPGQWRVLANMKEGLQNDAIGNEPVWLPRVSTILPHLYTGGWSATVDASKFFYQFPTVISERKFLGCVHPTTGDHYRYRGLPMGAGNSPAIAGRMGTTLLRKLGERRPDLFQGQPRDNTWHVQVSSGTTEHNPQCGKGRICVSEQDGLPVVVTWVHVDDFLLHGPTYAKTAAALSALMDVAIDVGILCNPGKTVPPTQRVKYCGFIYDTIGEPRLEIPHEKRSRALVQVRYTLTKVGGEFSRLALSVLNGILQSLVDATPTRLGQTFLRPLHDLISHDNAVTDPRAKFYTTTKFSPDSIAGLRWWETFLHAGTSRPVRPRNTQTLGCTWGDGSGTGTGGTSELLGDKSPMRMWMGTWEPHVHHFSSNWQELKTLALTLEQEIEGLAHGGSSRFTNKTLIYFTDNMTTYHVTMSGASSSPRLHALVKSVKTMELKLDCHLEVVHVPGTTMIVQGTDGISRGVWLSPLHKRQSSVSLVQSLFAPVTFMPSLIEWARLANPASQDLDKTWTHWRWDQQWDARHLFGRFSVWTPPPEMASQTISFVLQTWVEQPSTTSALFFIPRILQREWRSLSRHIEELTPLSPATYQDRPTVHLLPVTVLYLPTFVPSLRLDPSRMDRIAVPKNAKWHRQQAELLRGLPAEVDSD